MTPNARRFLLLDGVRGLAAVAVMFRHMAILGVMTQKSQSYLGVDLFFLLSGAVIAYAYETKLLHGQTVRDFMVRRVIRLYPMIAFGVLLGALNALFGVTDPDTRQHLGLAVLISLAILPNTPLFDRWDIDGPTWSLFYELLANIAYAALVRRLTDRRLLAVCGASALMLVGAAFYKGHLDTGDTLKSFGFGLGRVGFGFFGGVLLYRLHVQGRLRLPRALKGHWGVALACALTALALLVTPPAPLRPICALASVFILLPAIVVLGLENLHAPERTCETLGEISYPLYLIHAPLAFLTAGLLARFGLQAHQPLAAALFVPAMLVLALVVSRLYDLPVRSALAKALRARRTAPSYATS